MFIVSSQKFEGPLGVLLTMIENEKLDITEIALANIADQYVTYVQNNQAIDPEEVADFLVVAARLLWLKSKALLPYLISEAEEEVDDLEKQLRMYKQFAEASWKVADLFAQKKYQYRPEFNRQSRQSLFNLPLFVAPPGINPEKMKESMLLILQRLAEEKPLPEESLEEEINLEDRVLIIRQLLKQQVSFSFQSLIKQGSSKTEMVVNLLAILELIKQQELEFEQEYLFSDIRLLRPDLI